MKVSVLIPAYNAARFLPEALESILAQSYTDYEIIVVDDGSTDDTQAVCARYDMIAYQYQCHSGVAAARNAAIRASNGEIIAFLDADDIFLPEKLAKQMEYLDAHPDCSIVFSELRNFLDPSVTDPVPDQLASLNSPVPAALPTAVIRREVFEKVGLFNEDFQRGEDTEWLLRVSAAGIQTDHRIPEELYQRRIHGDNTTIVNSFSKDLILRVTRAAIMAKRNKTDT